MLLEAHKVRVAKHKIFMLTTYQKKVSSKTIRVKITFEYNVTRKYKYPVSQHFNQIINISFFDDILSATVQLVET